MKAIARAACVAAFCLMGRTAAYAQVDCTTPREQQDSVNSPRFAAQRQTMLSIEEVIRKNTAYMTPPEPVRMRTTIAVGPAIDGGSRIFVRAYPPKQGSIQIWTPGKCDVIPQSERVAASVGQIYAFVNYDVSERFLAGDEVPKYEGTFAGYPVYNGWVVITKGGRLPWIPQTLRDRLDREGAKRQRALEEWNQTKAGVKAPDEAVVQKTYEMLKKSDPQGAEKYLEQMRVLAEDVRKAKAAESLMDAHLQGHISSLQKYRVSFSPAQLDSTVVWADASGDAKRALDAQIVQFNQLSAVEQTDVDALGRQSRDLERQAQAAAAKNPVEAARLRTQSNELALKVREIRKVHQEKAFFRIQDARAEYDLVNLKPAVGKDQEPLAFKPDPSFPDMKDPARVQVITIFFWAKADPKTESPRNTWIQKAKETFDFAALAALLK